MDADFTPLQKYDLIYVASPYSKYVWGLESAWNDISYITGKLMLKGLNVYSPIVHGHKVSLSVGIPMLDHEFWLKYDTTMMNKSDALLVVKMPGWEDSYGVTYEIGHFEKNGKPRFGFDYHIVR